MFGVVAGDLKRLGIEVGTCPKKVRIGLLGGITELERD